jgi:hypothetical protein
MRDVTNVDDKRILTSFANFFCPSISLHSLTAHSQSKPQVVWTSESKAVLHQAGASSSGSASRADITEDTEKDVGMGGVVRAAGLLSVGGMAVVELSLFSCEAEERLVAKDVVNSAAGADVTEDTDKGSGGVGGVIGAAGLLEVGGTTVVELSPFS